MQTRRLGRTGHESSLAILGGVVFHFVEEDEAGEILQQALDRGVNHLDIAPGYGSAEATVGPHIPAGRDRLFIRRKNGKNPPGGRPRPLTPPPTPGRDGPRGPPPHPRPPRNPAPPPRPGR